MLKFYKRTSDDKLFSTFYEEITEDCPTHNPIRKIFLGQSDINDYLMEVPDILSDIDITIDNFEKILEIISPYAKSFCLCKRSITNLDIFSDSNKCKRLDLVEKIIYETELNDFYYFINLKKNIDNLKKSLVLPNVPINFNDIPEKTKLAIFDYCQTKYCKNVYVYQNDIISHELLPFMPEEKVNIYTTSITAVCTICEKKEEIIDRKIIGGIIFDEVVEKTQMNDVKDFACIKCKVKVGEYTKSKSPTCFINYNLIEPYGNKTFWYLYYRRIKHHLVISAKLFDENSSFSFLPMELIYDMIFSVYWAHFNAIEDISVKRNPNMIMYSKFRSIFGVNS